MTEAKPRVAIYARISSDPKHREVGVNTQLADCRDLAEREDYEVVSELVDNDRSASGFKTVARPGFEELLDLIAGNEINGVLYHKQDRITRDQIQWLEFEKACAQEGTFLHPCDGRLIDPSNEADAMHTGFQSLMASIEARRIRARIVRAKRQMAVDGKYRGGHRPYGFDADGMTHREDEADAIRFATEQILAGGSLRATCRTLIERGQTTSKGNEMTPRTLRAILLRPRNAGLLEFHGESIGPAKWEPIVPEEQWRALVATLKNPSRRTNTRTRRAWLGSGIYKCGICGGVCRCSSGGRGKKPYYLCYASKSHVARDADAVDEMVLHTVAEVLRRDVADAYREGKTDDTEVVETQQKIEGLESRLAVLTDSFADGSVSAEQLRDGSKRINQQLEAAKGKMAELATRSVLTFAATDADPGETFLSMDVAKQGAVVKKLVTVTIMPVPHGRPPGWQPGMPYFRQDAIKIESNFA